MSKFETLTVLFYCIIFCYLYFDYRYKEALGNAIHLIVKKLGVDEDDKDGKN